MTSQMFIPIHRKILLVLTCIAITAGCAGFEGQSKPAAVPEIHRGDGMTPSESNTLIAQPTAAKPPSTAYDPNAGRCHWFEAHLDTAGRTCGQEGTVKLEDCSC